MSDDVVKDVEAHRRHITECAAASGGRIFVLPEGLALFDRLVSELTEARAEVERYRAVLERLTTEILEPDEAHEIACRALEGKP